MARYAVTSKKISLDKVAEICAEFGATNIRKAESMNQLFCELPEIVAEKLKAIGDITVKPISGVKGMLWRISSGICQQ